MLFVDAPLARRLERAEGAVSARLIESRARLEPASGATWREINGAFAMFDSPGSPITQAFGLGMSGPTAEADVAAIEAFFTERDADTLHEVSPLAGVQTQAMLAERGYRPIELSNVLVRSLDDLHDTEPPQAALKVRIAEPRDEAAWVEAAVAGWAENDEIAPLIRGFCRVSFASTAVTAYLVEIDGAVVATASFGVHEGVALLAGASTTPAARNRGAQRALLVARLAEAKRRSCDVAMMATAPGSVSQRNAERNGFRVAYTRAKWRRGLPA
jgi:GNAT superfamily N-acetyltransferase